MALAPATATVQRIPARLSRADLLAPGLDNARRDAQTPGAELRIAHPVAVPEHVVNAPSRLGRSLDMGAQRGEDRAEPAGVEFGTTVPGPPVGVAPCGRPHGGQLDLAGLGGTVGRLAAAAFDLGGAHRHAGAVEPQIPRGRGRRCGLLGDRALVPGDLVLLVLPRSFRLTAPSEALRLRPATPPRMPSDPSVRPQAGRSRREGLRTRNARRSAPGEARKPLLNMGLQWSMRSCDDPVSSSVPAATGSVGCRAGDGPRRRRRETRTAR